MAVYNIFLTAMCALFSLSAVVLLGVTVVQALRSRRQRTVVYFGLTLLASVVAAGFYFFRRLL
jgi:Na+/melibiose symporter-like transporter